MAPRRSGPPESRSGVELLRNGSEPRQKREEVARARGYIRVFARKRAEEWHRKGHPVILGWNEKCDPLAPEGYRMLVTTRQNRIENPRGRSPRPRLQEMCSLTAPRTGTKNV